MGIIGVPRSTGKMPKNEATGVTMRRTIVSPVKQAQEILRMRISPFGVVEKEKLRVIQDLTFCGRVTVREAGGAGSVWSVNAETDWQRIPECRLAKVITGIITQTLVNMGDVRDRKGILLQKMDVKITLRQVGVAPGQAAAFAYLLEDLIFVDLRLQFGRCGSPG